MDFDGPNAEVDQLEALVDALTNDENADVALEQDQLQTLVDARDARPVNTSKAYRSKQREFIHWMEQQRFVDGITVTGPKVHSFLRTVMNRRNKRQAGAVIGYTSIKASGAACFDLYVQSAEVPE